MQATNSQTVRELPPRVEPGTGPITIVQAPAAQGRSWIDSLSAGLSPLVAILGIAIGVRQWRTAQNKLKLDLFENRLEIFEATQTAIASVHTKGGPSHSAVLSFAAATASARWLFNKQIADYLHQELGKRLDELRILGEELDELGPDDDRRGLVDQRAEQRKWITKQFPIIEEMFSPFLSIKG